MDVFSFQNYRDIITSYLAGQTSKRGSQKRLAEAAGCQASYFSQMLSGQVQLTLDQAAGIAIFLQFDEDETEYFLALVGYERSGSRHLQSILRQKLEKIRRHHSQLSSKIKNSAAVPDQGLMIYYSTWYYSAIHVLIAIPKFANEKAIAEVLGLSRQLVASALAQLEQMGLAEKQENKWISLQKNIHVPHNSPLYLMYHGIWRQLANRRMGESSNPADINYTALYAMSQDDFIKMRELVFNFIEETRKIVIPSPEEQLVCCLVDFFTLE